MTYDLLTLVDLRALTVDEVELLFGAICLGFAYFFYVSWPCR